MNSLPLGARATVDDCGRIVALVEIIENTLYKEYDDLSNAILIEKYLDSDCIGGVVPGEHLYLFNFRLKIVENQVCKCNLWAGCTCGVFTKEQKAKADSHW